MTATSFMLRSIPRAVRGILLLGLACGAPPALVRPPVAASPSGANAGDRVAGADTAAAERAAALAAAGFEPVERQKVAPSTRIEPPALPPALASPPEFTLELKTTSLSRGKRVERREDVARGADRVHVRVLGSDAEWLFVQNPVDKRRVSARRVDHRQHSIIEYEESELRMNGIARGWADVVTLGVELDALARLERSGRRQQRFGFEFIEWRAPSGVPPRDVWWSDEAALALFVSGAAPDTVVEVTSLARGVDRQRLLEPRERFAAYAVMDVADYREKHHDGAGEPASERAGEPHAAPH